MYAPILVFLLNEKFNKQLKINDDFAYAQYWWAQKIVRDYEESGKLPIVVGPGATGTVDDLATKVVTESAAKQTQDLLESYKDGQHLPRSCYQVSKIVEFLLRDKRVYIITDNDTTNTIAEKLITIFHYRLDFPIAITGSQIAKLLDGYSHPTHGANIYRREKFKQMRELACCTKPYRPRAQSHPIPTLLQDARIAIIGLLYPELVNANIEQCAANPLDKSLVAANLRELAARFQHHAQHDPRPGASHYLSVLALRYYQWASNFAKDPSDTEQVLSIVKYITPETVSEDQ